MRHFKEMSMIKVATLAAAFGAFFVFAPPASAQQCGSDGSGFRAWVEAFKDRGASQGLKPQTLALLDDVNYSSKVISLDRNQKSFKLSFEAFYARRVNNAMIKRAKSLWASNRSLFDSIEQRFGVPAPVLLAIWGLETQFGRQAGNLDIVTSLASLSYDCRRSAFFEPHLVGALLIIQRGDKSRAQLKGAWAGEIGQTQFMPANYVKYAVDADGDGRRDLISSVPDVLASTANFLRGHGWSGSSWGPDSGNYAVLKDWNRASVYVQTISVMADKIAE
jgi:lytic murein transglycosylase